MMVVIIIKRRINNLLYVVITILISGSLVSCNIIEGNSEKRDVKEIKIGITVYKGDDTFISTIVKNIEKVAKEKEIEENIKINIDILDAKGSQLNQNDQVDRLILQEYDVICVNMVDRTASAVIIDKVKKADIPVIFFNREPVEEDMKRWDNAYYVGAEAELAGKMQANIILDIYNKDSRSVDKNGDGKIQYAMLEGEQGHQDTLIRTEYAIKTIEENGIGVEKLVNDTANWQRSQGFSKMIQWNNKFHNRIEVIFSNNDDMALGAIDALDELNITEDRPIIVGVDATPEALKAVKNGTLKGTVISDSIEQATRIFNISYNLSTGGNVEELYNIKNSRYVKTTHTYVTEDNVDLYLEN